MTSTNQNYKTKSARCARWVETGLYSAFISFMISVRFLLSLLLKSCLILMLLWLFLHNFIYFLHLTFNMN